MSPPILKTHAGQFRGESVRLGNGEEVDAFYGVPFAKPPVGELRLEKPVPLEKSNQVFEALAFKKTCIQPAFSLHKDNSEDSLYLNCYRPKGEGPFPAFVWLHGGSLQTGSGAESFTKYAAEHFAAKGIVLITPQYRVSFLGFSSLDHPDYPGNLGLWDATEALRFVRQNADGFSVDVNRITLCGISSGAGLVSVMSVSPVSRDLFQQCIQLSGSSFMDLNFNPNAKRATLRVLKTLGISPDDPKKVKEELKKLSARDIQNAADQSRVWLYQGEPAYLDFLIRQDRQFIPSDIPDLIKESPPKPTLASLVENEGLLFTLYFPKILHPHALSPAERKNYSLEDLKRFIASIIVPEEIFKEKSNEIREKVLNFYLSLKPGVEISKNLLLELHGRIFGDLLIAIPQLLEMREKLEKNWPIYQLKNVYNEFVGDKLQRVEVKQTTHSYEIEYLFGVGPWGPHIFTEGDRKFSDNLIGCFVNFIKTGSPKSDKSPNFEKITKENPDVYSKISTTVTKKTGLYAKEFEFWSSIVRDYGFNIIRGLDEKGKFRCELLKNNESFYRP
ncbi:unnamed protein product [Bursaphelenchus xylophilus]|uniref:(pine wood nematode) hypothetical protein n=1 Tax=Bursaphelenchus xylophilus TaxID=6326 RepID=A0A7I8XMW2_BURXY|nr:unnamed protein product [Bursaphelenchus xylophilus]CAG9121905.1 unnamed protein product [Bursaphelenchus xylophilus]